MKKVSILDIKREQKESSKNGKTFKYESLRIQVKGAKGNIWLSSFGKSYSNGWKVGDSVWITDITKNEKGYWNFKVPESSEVMTAEVMEELKIIRSNQEKIIEALK